MVFFVTANFHIKVSAFQWWGERERDGQREREREKLELPAPHALPAPFSTESFVLIKAGWCLCCWTNAGLCSWLCAEGERESERSKCWPRQRGRPSHRPAQRVRSGKSFRCHAVTPNKDFYLLPKTLLAVSAPKHPWNPHFYCLWA